MSWLLLIFIALLLVTSISYYRHWTWPFRLGLLATVIYVAVVVWFLMSLIGGSM